MTTTETTAYINLLTDILAPRYELPADYDTFGIKSVRPDLRTRNGFRWPYPGNQTDVFTLQDHNGSCPHEAGDGLCVASTWAGMAAGGYPARTLLLLAYRSAQARGNDSDKLRVPQAFVVDLIDGEQLLVKSGRGADLYGADLYGADLRRADLRRAYLGCANLCCADLRRADLGGAYLRCADLRSANLDGANLGCADLCWADLRRADLRGVDLHSANLHSANLRSANLDGAIGLTTE